MTELKVHLEVKANSVSEENVNVLATILTKIHRYLNIATSQLYHNIFPSFLATDGEFLNVNYLLTSLYR